jgi:hypothetical protein
MAEVPTTSVVVSLDKIHHLHTRSNGDLFFSVGNKYMASITRILVVEPAVYTPRPDVTYSLHAVLLDSETGTHELVENELKRVARNAWEWKSPDPGRIAIACLSQMLCSPRLLRHDSEIMPREELDGLIMVNMEGTSMRQGLRQEFLRSLTDVNKFVMRLMEYEIYHMDSPEGKAIMGGGVVVVDKPN